MTSLRDIMRLRQLLTWQSSRIIHGDRYFSSIAQGENCGRILRLIGNRNCPALFIETRAVSTGCTCLRKKVDYEAAYDRIVKKRDRQEKAKDKYGKKIIEVWQGMTVKEVANALQRPLETIYEIMLYVDGSEKYDQPNSAIDKFRVLEDIIKRAGCRPSRIQAPAVKAAAVVQEVTRQMHLDPQPRGPPDPGVLVRRCPVVTVMGHVDHGKTTLLDALRNTSVVAQEFGGITQHIGAFSVKLPQSRESVTFLDTPGHAAFSAMRARGANITDIVVLVVAADDGVMEQTRESIRFAQAAKVPIIVAINKCDKPDLDIAAAKRGLWSENIALEEFGGDVQSVQVSALKKTGLDSLVEAILTQAEILQLKTDPTGPVEATVVESRTDLARGRLCTAIVQRGTLRKGAALVAGTAWAKVRGLLDYRGQPIPEAPPGIPVEILGWRDLPSAGDAIFEVANETRAQEVIAYREELKMDERMESDEVEIQKKREDHLKDYKAQLEKRRALGIRRRLRPRVTPEQLGPKKVPNQGPQVSVVVKCDVDGSLEAILDVLVTYRSPQCKLDIVHYGVGNVTENDITMAQSFGGIVYAFNVRATADVIAQAAQERVEIRNFNIIYRLVEDLKQELEDQLPTVDTEDQIGVASVLQGFVVKEGRKKLPVAGCRCVKGSLDRKARFKFMRGDQVLYDGALTSMRHLKQEVITIHKDQECGLAFEQPDLDFQLGDTIVCYNLKPVKQRIDWSPPGF